MSPADRERFDQLVQDVIDKLPPQARRALEEVGVVIEDAPDERLTGELTRDGLADPDEEPDVMGLHTGLPLTDGGLDASGALPAMIHLFREQIVAHALEFRGGSEPLPDGIPPPVWGAKPGDDDEVYEEIRITLLHELGHHFGLDEDDLDRLGYA